MSYVTFYCNDPNAPKPNMPAHLGANAIVLWEDKLLLERRRDSDTWGLPGGGVKKTETELQAMQRELYEELGLRLPKERFEKLAVYGEPGRIAAFHDGSVWRMVIVMYRVVLDQPPALRISPESKELRFFTRQEAAQLDIPATHRDIVAQWFIRN